MNRRGKPLWLLSGLAVASISAARVGWTAPTPKSAVIEYDLALRRQISVLDAKMQKRHLRRVDLGIYELQITTWRTATPAGWELTGFTSVELQPPSRTLPAVLAGSALFAVLRVRHLRRRAAAQQHHRQEQEADEARQMQRSLLPVAPPAAPGVQIAMLFQPAHEISGDFYLFPHAPPGTVRLVLGDVAGKGMPAALTATLAAGFLRAYADHAGDPAALLEAAGKSLRTARTGRTMVAACAAELGTEARLLRWCNAGLPPPALLRDGAVTWLPGTGVPLGSLPQVTYQGHEAALAAGDLVLLYTDGLIEATSPLGDLFGRERLGAALCRLPMGRSAAEALADLQREVIHFMGDAEPYDDITALALRVE